VRNFKSVLCIPDLHCPYHHPDAFKFLDSVANKYQPDKVVCLGDEIDGHSFSFHTSDPDLPFSPSKELEKAIYYLSDLYLLFPSATVIESNHGSLVYRRGKFHGLPRSVFRSYKEILEAPQGWVWKFDETLKCGNKSVYFHHGQSKNVLRNSKNQSMCYVQGHHHSTFDIQYWANSQELFWGVTSGCLIDKKSLAFAYGKNNLPKPILGCTVIIDGYPFLIPMKLKKNGRWLGKI
jgi:hypothetical protein